MNKRTCTKYVVVNLNNGKFYRLFKWAPKEVFTSSLANASMFTHKWEAAYAHGDAQYFAPKGDHVIKSVKITVG